MSTKYVPHTVELAESACAEWAKANKMKGEDGMKAFTFQVMDPIGKCSALPTLTCPALRCPALPCPAPLGVTSCDLYPSTYCFVSRQRLSHKHTNTVDQRQCLQTCGPPICCTCQTAAYAITNALLGEEVSQTPMLPSTTLCQSDYQICDGKLCMLDITRSVHITARTLA